MPMYEYHCYGCEITLVRLRRLSQRHEPLECPTCGGVAKFILSSFSIPKNALSAQDAATPSRNQSAPRIASGESVGIRVGPEVVNASIKNVTLEGFDVGISAHQNADFSASGVKFEGVKQAWKIAGSDG